MNEKANPETSSQTLQDSIQRKDKTLKTIFRTLLAVTTLFALLTTAFAQSNQGPSINFIQTIADTYYNGDLEAALEAFGQGTGQQLADVNYDSLTMKEIAILSGVDWPEPAAITAEQVAGYLAAQRLANADLDSLTMRETAELHGHVWVEPVTVTAQQVDDYLASQQLADVNFGSLSMKEIAILSGVDWPEPAILTAQLIDDYLAARQFDQAIAGLVLTIADTYYDGNVEEAFSVLEAAFVFDRTRERVIAGLSGR